MFKIEAEDIRCAFCIEGYIFDIKIKRFLYIEEIQAQYLVSML